MTTDSRRLLTFLGIFVIAMLIFWHLFSSYGLMGYFHLKNDLAALQAENDRLQGQNRQLLLDIKRFSEDDAFFSEIARKQHGMIKKNEIIFDFDRKR